MGKQGDFEFRKLNTPIKPHYKRTVEVIYGGCAPIGYISVEKEKPTDPTVGEWIAEVRDRQNEGQYIGVGRGGSKIIAAHKLRVRAQSENLDKLGRILANCDGCGKKKRLTSVPETHYRICDDCALQPMWF